MKHTFIILFLMLSGAAGTFAQNNAIPESEKAAYIKTITARADKIVDALNVTDAAKAQKAKDMVRDQYSNLNDIYVVRDEHIKDIKAKNEGDKAAMEAALKAENLDVDAKLGKLHKKYLKKLSTQLTPEQVEGVKNGMTYGVAPLTYHGYQEEILTLTDAQKKQIFAWLIEAREHAMDAESADKKHAWFGKYKGKINNFLSAAGYDMKKEGQAWAERRKAKAGN